ncbi:hypothetical protein ACTJJ4_07470 [Microbacterium sp. 22195]|uniref:hypothetical protein n=1 Tax=Microbacterium sp. 22195 TaxID=3453891 RepID=UPI003F84FF55
MTEITIALTDAEWAEALKAGFDAAYKARFVDGLEDQADEIGVAAGQAKAREIALRRARGL